LIFENDLVAVAQRIEKVLEGKQKPTESQISDFERELKAVINNVGTSEPAAPLDESEFLDPFASLTLLNKAAPLLKSRNTDRINLLDELRKVPNSAVLCQQIEDFDFTLALKTLEQIKATLKV
jgi:hypothetical protein